MFSAESLYGCQPQMPAAGVAAPTQQMGTDNLSVGTRGLLDPHNPLFWFGGFLLATAGFASVAGSARFGKAKVSAGVG
jgi:hypothetical protein